MKDDNKEFCLRELFDTERIGKLISVIPTTIGTDAQKTFEYNGKNYTIKKNDRYISLLCDDGRKLKIYGHTSKDLIPECGESASEITYLTTSYRINNSRVIWAKAFENKDLIDFINPEAYKSYGTSQYCHFETCVTGPIVPFNHFTANSIDGIYIDDDGIKNGEYLISKDCENIISKDGVKLPPKEVFTNFSYKSAQKETLKILKTINDTKLNTHIKNEIIERFSIYGLINDYNKVKELYNKLPSLKEAMKFQKTLYDDSIKNYIYNSDELDLFINELNLLLGDTIADYNDKQLLADAKKMVKALSNRGLDSLERMINNRRRRG